MEPAVKDQALALLEDWTDLTVEDMGPFWLIAGNDPQGVRRSGCNADVLDLAQRMAEQGRAPLALVETPFADPFLPEPVSVEPVTPTSSAAPDDASAPVEDDGGSSFLDMLARGDANSIGGIGVMVNNTGGVMASDRTEELRAKKIGETVMEHRRLVDAAYTVEEAHTLQQLRSRSNGAAEGDLNPLTDEEQATLDRLALEEAWAARMDAELQRRLAALAEADGETLAAYVPRGDWPQ